MSKPAIDKETKIAALLVSGLMMTPADDLEGFRKKRLGHKSKVSVAHVQLVRELAMVLAAALKRDDDTQWTEIEKAAAILLKEPPPPPSESEAEAEPESESMASLAAEMSDSGPSKPAPVGAPIALDEVPANIAAEINKPSPWVAPSKAVRSPTAASAPLPPGPPVSADPAPAQPAAAVPDVSAADKPPPSVTAEGADPAPNMGQVAGLPFDSGRKPDSETLPRDESAAAAREQLADTSAGEPPMTLSTYAAFRACCGAFPAQVQQTHTKFGLADQAARTTLDSAWQECFDADPRLQQLYEALFRRFRSWLVQYGGV